MVETLGRPEAGVDITKLKILSFFLMQILRGQPAETNSIAHWNGGAGALQFEELDSEKEEE